MLSTSKPKTTVVKKIVSYTTGVLNLFFQVKQLDVLNKMWSLNTGATLYNFFLILLRVFLCCVYKGSHKA